MNPTIRLPRLALLAAMLGLGLALAGCGGEPQATDTRAESPSAAPTHLLTSAPGEPISILQALEKAEGEEVVLEGRVSSLEKGFAAFTLTDDSVPYCGRDEDCGCPTPWDYCCEEDAAKAGRIPVEMRDAAGQPVADGNTGLRLLDLVVMKGTIGKTESGGKMLVVHDGWFRKERPELPKGVAWPQ